MRGQNTVVLDACVLAEAAVSDLLLRLSEEPGLVFPQWSELIWEETHRTWTEKLGWPEATADSRMAAAKNAFPEAMVEGFESIMEMCRNHPKDRHVLAMAIFAKVEIIVTFNIKDYPKSALEPWGIRAAHPQDFLIDRYDFDPDRVTDILRAMANRARRSPPEMLARLAWYVPNFSEYVAGAEGVTLPSILPRQWQR